MENAVSRFVDDIEVALKVLKEMESVARGRKKNPGSWTCSDSAISGQN